MLKSKRVRVPHPNRVFLRLGWETQEKHSTIAIGPNKITQMSKTKSTITDSHFLIPAIVFCLGLALLVAVH
jgi:hypothetical protein